MKELLKQFLNKYFSEDEIGPGEVSELSDFVERHSTGFLNWVAVNKWMPVNNNWQMIEPEFFNIDIPSKQLKSSDLFKMYISDLERKQNGK